MAELKINYDEIFNLIHNNIISVMEDSETYYEQYEVILGVEQQFIKQKDMKENAIYIVVKYLPASVNFGQSVLPVTLTAISEQNRIDVCQRLLLDMAQKFNLTRTEDGTIQQIFESPTVTSNFNNVFQGFRSVLYTSVTFVISKNANFYSFIYRDKNIFEVETVDSNIENLDLSGFNLENDTEPKTYKFNCKMVTVGEEPFTRYEARWFLDNVLVGDNNNLKEKYNINLEDLYILEKNYISITTNYKKIEEIPFISSSVGGDIQLDSQPFFNTNNFTKSLAKFGTLTFNISTYLLDDIKLINDVLDIAIKNTDDLPEGVNKTFLMEISFKNKKKIIDEFKIVNFSMNEQIAQIPSITFTFTN